MEFKKKIISSRDKIQVKKESAKKSTVSREEKQQRAKCSTRKVFAG